MNVSSNIIEEKLNCKVSKLDSILASIGILQHNTKIMLNFNVLAAVAYIMLIPMIASLKLLDCITLARIGEFYLSIIGIILLPYIASLENRDNIKEVIYSRKIEHFKIVLIRIIIAIAFMLIMIISVMTLAKIQGSTFKFWEITFGTWISAVFLGMIGFTVANLIDNISAAYLISFVYYFMEYVTKGKYTKKLYLFSLTKGSFSKGKYELLLVIFIMMIVNLFIIKKKS